MGAGQGGICPFLGRWCSDIGDEELASRVLRFGGSSASCCAARYTVTRGSFPSFPFLPALSFPSLSRAYLEPFNLAGPGTRPVDSRLCPRSSLPLCFDGAAILGYPLVNWLATRSFLPKLSRTCLAPAAIEPSYTENASPHAAEFPCEMCIIVY